MNVEQYIRAMPKVELHLHLEGSIRPEILLQLARKNGVALPYETVEGLRGWYQFRDFDHFVDIYLAICSALQSPEDFALITYDLGKTLATQNCRYTEVTWTPGIHAKTYEDYLRIFDGIVDGQRRAEEEFGIEMRWIPDVARQFSPEHGDMIARWISTPESKQRGVVAFGIGGPEVGHPPEKFEWAAALAANNGVPCNPHAGETVGPRSIWNAILVLNARRIKHGIRAIEDPELVDYLAQHNILIEVCPTSNLCLSVYPGYDDYPLKALAAKGVPFTVSSDDPPMFNTTLTDEYLHVVQDCELSLEQLEQSVLDGLRHSYLPDERKKAMLTEFQAEFNRLRTET
ncbi:MAG: adenosine deaminase [Chloroflexi bacterium]|nr:adenosine deaminase [Chloroflexota bacterium]